MKITVKLLDVWRLIDSNSRRIVVRDSSDINKFTLVSMGTGDSSKAMTAKEIFDYLVYGLNPLKNHDKRIPVFNLEMNLKNWAKDNLEDFGNFDGRWVWEEEVTDPEIINLHIKDI